MMEPKPTTHGKPSAPGPVFQCLSSGIGLGGLRAPGTVKSAVKIIPSPVTDPASLRQASQVSQVIVHTGMDRKSKSGIHAQRLQSKTYTPVARKRPPLKVQGRFFRLFVERMLLACGIDLFFVMVNLLVAFCCVTLMAYLRAEKGANLLELSPLAWISGLSLLRLIGGFIAIYLVYVLAFLVSVGSTLGAMSLKPSSHPSS